MACVPAFLVLALAQLIGALYGPVAGVLVAFAVGVAAFLAPRTLSAELEQWWAVTLLAASSSAFGIALPMFAERPQWGMLLFPVIAGSVACLIALMRTSTAPRCASCDRTIKGGSFACPRCGQTVCDQSCWNFQTSRCSACEEQKVQVLGGDTAWWERNVGRRIPKGKCQICHTVAEEADLRACQECARPYCRGCWDASNGQCSHCLWTVRELPAALRRFVMPYDSPTRSTRRVRPRTG
ncbi:MAG: hypothetical protein ABI806_00900 [Candidatus Solibacter sp.]